MEISVIVAYYNNLPFLEMVLKGLERQSFRDFEVIIAEDDRNAATKEFLQHYRKRTSLELIHVDREKKEGFRKNQMLNRAIRRARGEKLVFLDGDCIPHRHHLKQYSQTLEKGFYRYGRRVLLGPRITQSLLSGKSLRPLRFLPILASDSRNIKEGIYSPWFRLHSSQRKLSGCNWGVSKSDIEKVNGFDERFIRAGVGEDFDIEWRMETVGIRKRSIRNRAVVYHLHHPVRESRTEDEAVNTALLKQNQEAGQVWCEAGLVRKAESY